MPDFDEDIVVDWLIVPYGSEDHLRRLSATVDCCTCQRSRVVPYIPMSDNDFTNLYKPDDCVIVIGSVELTCGTLYTNPKLWTPGVWYNKRAFNCTGYYGKWSKYIVQRNWGMYPLGAMADLRDDLFRKFSAPSGHPHEHHIFLRPNDNEKSFPGELVHFDEYMKWFETVFGCRCDRDSLIVVSQPEVLATECRVLVVDNKIVDGSYYRVFDFLHNRSVLNYSRGVPKGTETLLAELTHEHRWSNYSLPRVYCLDVADTRYGLKVVEISSFNAAGLYDMNLTAVVDAVGDVARSEWKEQHQKD